MAITIRRNQSGSLNVRLVDSLGNRITAGTSVTGTIRRLTGNAKTVVSVAQGMTYSADAHTDLDDPGYNGQAGAGTVYGAWQRPYTAANFANEGTYELEVNYSGSAGTFQEFYTVIVRDNKRE